MKINHESDNWQSEAPQLAQMEKINPFQVPQGYFDTLSARIQNRIDAQEKPKSGLKMIPIWAKYAAAACITLALGITLYLNLNQNQVNFNELSDEEIIAYLETNLEETDTEFIFESLNENQQNIKPKEITNQEVEEYLNNTL